MGVTDPQFAEKVKAERERLRQEDGRPLTTNFVRTKAEQASFDLSYHLYISFVIEEHRRAQLARGRRDDG